MTMTRCANCDSNTISDESEEIYCRECYGVKVEKIADLELTIEGLEDTIIDLNSKIESQIDEWKDMKSEIYNLYAKF